MKPKKTSDRRTRRSRHKVSGALVDLIKEKRFDDITVQNVVDRAGVGRATFYSHFRDKEDAFEQQWEGFNQMLAEKIGWDKAGKESFFPVTFFFRHLQDSQSFYHGLVRSGKIDGIFKRGIEYLSRHIESALNKQLSLDTSSDQGLKARPVKVPIPILSYYLATEFFALLRWWLDAGMPYTPEAMDKMFHRLINPTIKSALQ